MDENGTQKGSEWQKPHIVSGLQSFSLCFKQLDQCQRLACPATPLLRPETLGAIYSPGLSVLIQSRMLTTPKGSCLRGLIPIVVPLGCGRTFEGRG